MGRRKLGETTKVRITLPPDASPNMVILFDRFKKMKPMEAIQFLYELSQNQAAKVTQTDEERIEQSVLAHLKHYGRAQMDDLIRESGFPTHKVSAHLMMMELMGAIKRSVGNIYVLP